MLLMIAIIEYFILVQMQIAVCLLFSLLVRLRVNVCDAAAYTGTLIKSQNS